MSRAEKGRMPGQKGEKKKERGRKGEADSLGRTCFRNRTQEDEEEQEDERDH